MKHSGRSEPRAGNDTGRVDPPWTCCPSGGASEQPAETETTRCALQSRISQSAGVPNCHVRWRGDGGENVRCLELTLGSQSFFLL